MRLDTRGVADGFAQGFGLMDNYYARQNQQRLQEQQMGLQLEQNDRANRQMEMQERRFGLQEQEFKQRQEAQQREQDLQAVQFALGKIAQGLDVADEELEVLRRYPKYWSVLDPRADQSIAAVERLFDTENPAGMNDPEVLEAVNQLLEPEINKGSGGRKRIVGMYPSPDGEHVMFDLAVVGDGGNEYTAPMTVGRGVAGEDDEVMQVPVDKLIEQAQGFRLLRNVMRTPEAQQRATTLHSMLTGKQEQAKYSDIIHDEQTGMAYQRDERTGEIKQLDPRKTTHASGGRGGAGQDPADIRSADLYQQRLKDDGINISWEQAYERVRTAVSNPEKYVSDFVKSEVEAQKLMPSSSRKTRAELEAEALESWRRLRNEIDRAKEVESGVTNTRPAPPAAIEYLRNNPQAKDHFLEKYGYLPDGF